MDAEAGQILDEMQEYLNAAKYALLSNRVILVDRAKMEEFVRALRQCLEQE